MSIMRDKPIICQKWFEVSTLNNFIGGEKLDIIDFINVSDFLDAINRDIETMWEINVKPLNSITDGSIWTLSNPFKYPRFRLFQIENSCLLCEDLIK